MRFLFTFRFVVRDKKYWYFAFHPCGSFSMFTGPPTEGGYACLDAAVCP